MITKLPYGLSPTVDIAIGNSTVDYNTINRVELFMEDNQHDMLVMEIAGIPPRAITSYYNKPVQVKISTGGNFYQAFYGYVEDIRPSSFTGFGLMNDSPFQEAKIVCMGVSYDMRGATSKVWNGYRLSDIAREISAKYRFSVDVPSDEFVHDSLLQTNESDWQFLSRYTKFLGYSVSVHGTHIHIYDPYSSLSRQSSYHKLTTLLSDKRNVNASPGQIIEFEGTFSKRNIDGEYKESTIPVVNADASTYDVSSTSLEVKHNGIARFPNRISEYVDNFSEASRRISSVAKEKYDYYADVTVLGVAGCVPGGVVSVDKYNGDFDGFWYVQAVKHVVHSGNFVSELKLAKNYNSKLQLDNTEPFQSPPTPYYDVDHWVSSRARYHEYS